MLFILSKAYSVARLRRAATSRVGASSNATSEILRSLCSLRTTASQDFAEVYFKHYNKKPTCMKRAITQINGTPATESRRRRTLNRYGRIRKCGKFFTTGRFLKPGSCLVNLLQLLPECVRHIVGQLKGSVSTGVNGFVYPVDLSPAKLLEALFQELVKTL